MSLPTDGIMQEVTGEYQALVRDPESAGDSTRGIGGHLRNAGGRLGGMNPSLAAVVTWVVCLPVAFAGAALGSADPFRLRVAMVPVVVLVSLGYTALLRRPRAAQPAATPASEEVTSS